VTDQIYFITRPYEIAHPQTILQSAALNVTQNKRRKQLNN